MKLYPDEYVRDIFSYDFKKAYILGKRLVLFDIDNTMVPHGYPADEKSEELIRKIKSMGYKLCAVSNNKEPRVKMFCDKTEVPYVFDAQKPKPLGYERAMHMCGASAEETLFFGDQIFTDIIGANNAGIHSILVKPIDRKTDKIQIKFKRLLEKPIVKSFFKYKKLAINDYFI